MNRFEHVKYDDRTIERNAKVKEGFEQVEKAISFLPEGRYKSLALTALEEAYMWVGKSLRDFQLGNQGTKSSATQDRPVGSTSDQIPAGEVIQRDTGSDAKVENVEKLASHDKAAPHTGGRRTA